MGLEQNFHEAMNLVTEESEGGKNENAPRIHKTLKLTKMKKNVNRHTDRHKRFNFISIDKDKLI